GGFQQEGAGAPCGDLAVDAHGRLPVGEEFPQHRHDPMTRGQGGVELGARRGGHGIDSSRNPMVGSSGVTSKQLCAPVWQAGPCCSTLTSSVSPSQSRAAPFTYCRLPLVSPLRQYSWRLRDQKVTRPSARVRRSASASM